MSDGHKGAAAISGSDGHTPNALLLPKCVSGWVSRSEIQDVFDGEQWLMAVPVSVGDGARWYYEYSVVTMQCDENYFGIDCDGEPWGWSLDDVDFGVRLSR